MSPNQPESIPIHNEADIVRARQAGRALASELGFTSTQQTLVATAISELARNIVSYAQSGEVELTCTQKGGGRVPGIVICARDQGPGIAEPELAMRDGFSTGGGLGLGLPGCKRLADDFHLDTTLGQGTRVTMTMWRQ